MAGAKAPRRPGDWAEARGWAAAWGSAGLGRSVGQRGADRSAAVFWALQRGAGNSGAEDLLLLYHLGWGANSELARQCWLG